MGVYELEDFKLEELDETDEIDNTNIKASILERNRQALKNFLLWRKEKSQKEQVMRLGDLPERT